MTRAKLYLIFLFLEQVCFSQGFKTLDIEKKNINTNNKIFKIGNAFVYDYVIIKNDSAYKLNYIEGLPDNSFKLVNMSKNTNNSKIHLIIPNLEKSERTNKNQTEIWYMYFPGLSFISGTGGVENKNNVWIHPPRDGFFQSLETCPFPYIKFPIEIGKKWKDKMKIGEQWSNELWGVWRKKLLLSYDYNISKKTKVKTDLGELECFVVESTAKSVIGVSKLKSYFSEEYGFVRLEYEMTTGLKINLWLDRFSVNDFNDQKGLIKYIDEQKKAVANML